MIKIMDNTYRDIRFAYSNEMALIAENLNLDIHEAINAANVHYPRNNIPMPSPGVGGASVSKDPYILANISTKNGYTPHLILKAREINEKIPKNIVYRIKKSLNENKKELRSSTVMIAGFAFKGNPPTADLRDSTTLWILEELFAEQVQEIRGYDPIVDKNEIKKLNVIPTTFNEKR